MDRDARRKSGIENYRHRVLGMLMDALVQAKDRQGAELSRWLSLQAGFVNKLIGEMFDDFAPDPSPVTVIPAPRPMVPAATGVHGNGQPRPAVKA